MVNDEDRRARVNCAWYYRCSRKGKSGWRDSVYSGPLGAQSYTITLKTPAEPGKYALQAIAASEDNSAHPTISHREYRTD